MPNSALTFCDVAITDWLMKMKGFVRSLKNHRKGKKYLKIFEDSQYHPEIPITHFYHFAFDSRSRNFSKPRRSNASQFKSQNNNKRNKQIFSEKCSFSRKNPSNDISKRISPSSSISVKPAPRVLIYRFSSQ